MLLDPGIHYDVPEIDYHADPCDRPSLSASTAKVLLAESPCHAWHFHPKGGGHSPELATAKRNMFDAGSLLHSLILGDGPDLVIVDERDWKKKAAQQTRKDAQAAGRLAVLKHKLDGANDAAAYLRKAIKEWRIPLTGKSEVVAVWDEQTDSGPVRCRARLDHIAGLDPRGPVVQILEAKCGETANPEASRRKIHSLGYDIQAAAYTSAIETLFPALAGRVDFLWLFCAADAPHLVTPGRPDGPLMAIGQSKWRRACETWGKCLKSDHWPGYVEEPTTFEALPWALTEEMGAEL